jgi:Nuclease-related domain
LEARPEGWLVKYDGVCSRCGVPLHAGEVAVYDRPTRSIHCVVCPIDGGSSETAPIDPGVAGASARREFERRKNSREERVRSRLGDRLGRVVLAVTDDPQSTRAWARGAGGEEKLAKALSDLPDLIILNDRAVPGTRGNIDHIVIAPAGVFVIDAKRYEGHIEIRNRGNIFRPDYRLYVGRRDCSALADGLAWQVEAVTAALSAASVDPPPSLTPVLCFVDGDWPLIARPKSFRGVRLEGPRSLRKLASGTPTLHGDEVERLARAIALALPAK